MRLSLCLEMLWPGKPFPERIRSAAQLGYRNVEFWAWRGKDLSELTRTANGEGVRINALSGNREWTMVNPADRTFFVDEIRESIDVARTLESPVIMLLTDRLLDDGRAAPLPDGLTAADKRASVEEGLRAAAEAARGSGVTLALEPLNTKLDHPGYWLATSAVAFEIVRAVNAPEARVLYDAYHMAMMGENIYDDAARYIAAIAHVHAADVPGRHEPGTGDIDWSRFLSGLAKAGYDGAVGLEFSPLADSTPAARTAMERMHV